MKKADLATLAEQDMADSRWVPALVRGPKRKAAASGRKRPAAPAATARKSGSGTGAGSDDVARASRRKKASGRPADAAAGGKVRRSWAAAPPAPAGEDPSTERMAA